MNRQKFFKVKRAASVLRLSGNRPLSELLWRATCPVNTGHVDEGGQSSNFHSVIFIKVTDQNVNRLVITCHVQLKLKGNNSRFSDGRNIWIICIFIGRNRRKWNHSFFNMSRTSRKIYMPTICHLAAILNFLNLAPFLQMIRCKQICITRIIISRNLRKTDHTFFKRMTSSSKNSKSTERYLSW